MSSEVLAPAAVAPAARLVLVASAGREAVPSSVGVCYSTHVSCFADED